MGRGSSPCVSRGLVRRKWTYQSHRQRGRPRPNQEIKRLVVRLARENRDWGNLKIAGELAKLDIELSDETVADILRRHGIPHAPERGGSPSWRQLMTHYKDQILACDFFTVETLFLQTLYVFFFIELGSRRVHSPPAPSIRTQPGLTNRRAKLSG